MPSYEHYSLTMITVISTAVSRRQKVRGVTLIELMVGLVIGIVLALAASTVYLYSKQSFNSSSETSQLEENGRFAINLLTRYIQGAGYVVINPTTPFPQGPIDTKVRGCDLGFVNPISATSISDLACATSTPAGARTSAGIAVFNETDPYNGTGAAFQGFDCVGISSINIPTASGSINETRSYFFVSNTNVQTPTGIVKMGQLSCVSDRTDAAGVASFQAQPLIPGIEQIAFTYLLPSAVDPDTAQAPSTAASMPASPGWPGVLAVELCVLGKSVQNAGNDTGTQYRDCYNNVITAIPGEVYRTFRTTVRLRNKSV